MPFREAGIIEKYGSGIQRISSAFVSYGIEAPVFEEFQNGFRVTVFNTTTHNSIDVVDNVVDNENTIVALLYKNNTYSASEIANVVGLNQRTIQRYLKHLQEKNRIERVGSAKGGDWVVKK